MGKRSTKKASAPSLTAVIYARFSCSKQREASIDDQLRVCRQWCVDNGYTVVDEYCDYAMSGRSDERPEFQKMVRNAGESSIVLVYMMDRFSRDVYDAPIYKKRLRDKGVRVVSATEAMPDGPEAILIESVYEAMAAMESAHTSQRVRRGMEGNALKCQYNGDRLYGYAVGDDGCYVVREDEAAIVREVFRRKTAGEPVNSIAVDLANRGIRTGTGCLASYGFVYNMLKREKYTGTYIWGDVRVEGGMPAIVTKDEFQAAQNARPRKQRATETWGEFPLSGRAICEGCGHNLVGVSGRGRGGRKYDYYRCAKKCGCKAVRADWLEGTIVDTIRSMLSDRGEALRVARIVERHARDEGTELRVKEARKRKQEAERGIDRLMDAIANGLDYSLAIPKVESLREQMRMADEEISRLGTLARFDAEEFADFLQYGGTMTDEKVLDAFVWRVAVGTEDVIVVLNYDRNENEPAQIDFGRVRRDSRWWTTVYAARNSTVAVSYDSGAILMRISRAA